MTYFVALFLLFLTNCLVPTAVSATVNAKNSVTHSRIMTPKKLTYKERVVLNYQKLKAKFKAKIKTESLILGILGALALAIGILFLVAANRRKNSQQPQASVGDEPGAFVIIFGVLAIVVSVILFLIAIFISI